MRTKLFYGLLLNLFCTIACIETYAQTLRDTFTVNDIEYEVIVVGTPNQVSAIDYIGTGTAVTIPETVTDSNSIIYDVTRIGTQAFYDGLLESVVIGNNVTTIGNNAFKENSISALTLGESVTSITYAAFSDNELTNIIIPASVTTFGAYAFRSNPLTTVELKNETAVTPPTQGFYPFNGANSHSGVNLIVPADKEQEYMDAGWREFKTVNGIDIFFTIDNFRYEIFDLTNNKVNIFGYYGSNTSINILETVTNLSISYTIVEIGDGAFNNKALESIIIPNTVNSIGQSAFSNNNLITITIPAYVTSIGDYAFRSNPDLEEVISNSEAPALLPSRAFSTDMNNGTIDLIIPEGFEQAYIDADWRGFKTVNSLVFSFIIDDISYEIIDFVNKGVSIVAYSGTSTSLIIPSELTYLSDTYDVISIESGSFNGNSTLESIIIGDSVKTIESYAFYNLSALESITLPVSLTNMGNYVLQDCFSLTDIISLSTNPPTISEAFEDINTSSINLTIPEGTEQAYIDANWRNFKSVNTISEPTASILNTEFNSSISTYPNPVVNSLQIELATTQELEKVEVFTLSGKKVLEANTISIDFNSITSGVYMLKITNTDGKVRMKKIIRK